MPVENIVAAVVIGLFCLYCVIVGFKQYYGRSDDDRPYWDRRDER